MAPFFLNPDNPLPTCRDGDCRGCVIADRLICHFGGRQLVFFLALALPVFLIAGYALYRFSPVFLIPWFLLILAYFGFIEIRVMCSHCPHYAEPVVKTLKCWANYGSPKLWKYRPGPMSGMEKAVFYAGFLLLFLPSAVFSLLQQEFLFLILYCALLAAWKRALTVFFCRKCINFACPFNCVGEEIRRCFLEKNPEAMTAREQGSS